MTNDTFGSDWVVVATTKVRRLLIINSNELPVYYNDMWIFDTQTSSWAWVLGDNATIPASTENKFLATKTLQNPAARACPTFWTDSNNNLWIYGGYQGTLTESTSLH